MSSSAASASSMVRGHSDPEKAALELANSLEKSLRGRPPTFILWFAKGYGGQKTEILGSTLAEYNARRGYSAVVVGSSSEGGVIGGGEEAQEEQHALAGMAVCAPGIRAHSFYSPVLEGEPRLGPGGSWEKLARGSNGKAPAVLAFSTLPIADDAGDPQDWLTSLDRTLDRSLAQEEALKSLPCVVGGLPVGNRLFVDGYSYSGGCFGLALECLNENASLDPLVCQGSVPFGPWLEITGVGSEPHVITEIDGQLPKEVLLPIMHGPSVPGEGHTMAGIFVDPTPVFGLPGTSKVTAGLAQAALEGRPSSLVRPLHHFTDEGYLIASPLPEALPYAPGMKLQLQCHSSQHALDELRARAEHDLARHGGRPPDAMVMISCGARGVSLHGKEGVESRVLQETWGEERVVPSIGVFAGGEMGPVGLKSYLHGYTTTCLLIRS